MIEQTDPIKDLYKVLSQGNDTKGLFIDESDLRENIKKDKKGVYEYIKSSNLFIDYDDYENSLGLKKKEPSVGGSPAVSPIGGQGPANPVASNLQTSPTSSTSKLASASDGKVKPVGFEALGLTPDQSKTANILLQNKDKDFVSRMLFGGPSITNADKTTSTHKLATININGKETVIPTIQKIGGKLVDFGNDIKKATDAALKSGDYISFDNPQDAKKFAEGSWKEVADMYQKAKKEGIKTEGVQKESVSGGAKIDQKAEFDDQKAEFDEQLKRMQLGLTPGGALPKAGEKTIEQTIKESGGHVAKPLQTPMQKAMAPTWQTEAGIRENLKQINKRLQDELIPEKEKADAIKQLEQQKSFTENEISKIGYGEGGFLKPEDAGKLEELQTRLNDLGERIKFEKLSWDDQIKAKTVLAPVMYATAGGQRILEGVSSLLKGPAILLASDNDVAEVLSWTLMAPAKAAWEIAKPENATAKDNPTYQLGELLNDWTQRNSYINPLLEDNFSYQLTKALTGDLPYYGVAGLAGPAGVSAVGFFDNAVSEYETARKKTFDANNLSKEEFLAAYKNEDGSNAASVLNTYESLKGKNPEEVGSKMFLMAGAVGTLEGLPFVNWLNKFDKRTGGFVTKYFEKKGIQGFVDAFEKSALNPLATGVEEAAQEAMSQYLTNVSANKIYDESRNMLEGLEEGAAIGFSMGFLSGALKTGVSNLVQRRVNADAQEKAEIDRTLALYKEYERRLLQGEKVGSPKTLAAKQKVDAIKDKIAQGNLTETEASALEEAKESAEKDYQSLLNADMDRMADEGKIIQLQEKAEAVKDVAPEKAADFLAEAERLKAELPPAPEVAPVSEVVTEQVQIGEPVPSVASPTQEGQLLPLQEGAESQAMAVPEVSGEAMQAKSIIDETKLITSSTIEGNKRFDDTIGNDVDKLDADPRFVQNGVTRKDRDGNVVKDTNGLMGKTAFYRTIKGKSGKNYISVTLPTSDAAGREGGASVILEMTGEMTPEMESALLDLNVNSYKESEESNVVKKDGLERFKADVVGILSGKQPPQKVASPAPQVQAAPEVSGEATQTNPALADVESTAKALEGDVKYKEELKKEDILDDITDEKIGEKEYKRYRINTIEGGESSGRIYGEEAYIDRIKSKAKTTEYGAVRGTKMYERLLFELSKRGVKTVNITRQSADSRKVLDKLVEYGILINPRNLTGVSVDRHPMTFDINANILKPSNKALAEAYHKAKADGSNPELVKAVEELLAPEAAQNMASPETETQKKDDNKDTQGVSGQGRIGQEPVQAEPEQRGGRETAPASGVLQTPEQKEGVVGEAAKAEPEKVASPKKRESVKAKQIRLAREKIKTEQDKQEQLKRIREEKKRIAEERKLAAQQVKDKTAKLKKLRVKVPASAYEGVIQFLANGGKVKESEFAQETGWSKQKNKEEFKIRRGMLDENAATLDETAMVIAENMLVPEEVYDEVQAEIYSELKEALRMIRNQTQASEELLKINQDREAQYEKEIEGLEEYERSLMEAPPLEDMYTEEELRKMAEALDAISKFEAEKIAGPPTKIFIPSNKREQIISDIDRIKQELNQMSRGRLSSLPVDVIAKYVELATKYIELGVVDAYKFLDQIRSDLESIFGEVTPEIEKQILSAHDEAMTKLKPSKFAKTVAEAKVGISASVKEAFEKEGAMYVPKTIKDSALSANELWNIILEENNNDIDAAVKNAYVIIMRDDWGGKPEQVAILGGMMAKKLNEMSQKEGISMDKISQNEKMAVDILTKIRQRMTNAGAETSIVGKFMKDMFMAYPEAVVSYVYTEIDTKNDLAFGSPSREFTGTMEQIVADIISTEEGRLAMEQLGIGKKDKIRKKYDKRQKAVSDAFDRVINDLDSFTSGVSFAVPIPPAVIKAGLNGMKKAIVSGLDVLAAVEIAVNEVARQMQGTDFDKNKARAFFKNIADKVLGDVDNNANPEFVTEQMRKKLEEAYQQKVEKAKKAMAEFDKKKAERQKLKEQKDATAQAKKEAKEAERAAAAVAREAQKQKDAFENALNKLKGDKLRQFAFNIAKNFGTGAGSVSQMDIVRAFHQAMGGVQLTAQQQAQLSQAAKTIAAANTLSAQASQNSSQQFMNQWIQAQYAASQAASQISRMLNPRRWVDLFQNTMVMGYITFKTIGANPVSNAMHKIYSSLYDDLLFSFVDVLYAPGQKTTFVQRFKSLFNIEPTRAYVSQLPGSVKRAFDVMKEGTPAKDVDRYGGGYNIKPLTAWQNLIADVRSTPGYIGKMNQTAKNLYEGTVGITAATMSRLLTAGDITFKDPESAKIYQKWADDMGVDVDEFLTSDEFAEYRYYALEYAKMIIFQQENLVSKNVGKRIPKGDSELMEWFNLLVVKPIIPFFGTPINIKHEMLTMIPPISFAESMYHARKASDSKLSDAEKFFHSKMAQKMMRRAVGSLPLYAAVSALLASGLIYVIPRGDDEDEAEKENIKAFEGMAGRIVIKGTDTAIDGLKFGPIFDYMMFVDGVNKKYAETESVSAATMEGLITTTRSTIDNTYLQGVKNVMEGLSAPEKNMEKVLINTYGSAYANILFPTLLSALTQMSDKEKVLRLSKDESFQETLYNKVIRERIGFIDSDYTDIEKLPVRVNVLGEPIKTDREGRIDILHYMFDISRSQPYRPEEKFQVQIYKNYLKTEDKEWLYPVAPRNVTFEKEDIKLTPVLRNEYQRMLGQEITKKLQGKYGKVRPVPESISLEWFKNTKNNIKEKVKKEFMKKYDSEIQDLYKEKLEKESKAGPRELFR